MTLRKRQLLLCIVFILVVSLNCLSGIALEEIKDIDGHWAEDRIQKAVSNGYASGYNKNFRPNDSITRAEFITLINKYFGYNEKGNINFKDVSKKSWYYKDISIASLAGYVSGDSKEIFRPDDYIKREEAAVIISQIIKPNLAEKDAVSSFKDKKEIAHWSKNAFNAIVKEGYVSGYKDKTLKPKAYITRAEAITLINNVVGKVYDKKGVYGKTNKKEAINKNVLVNKPDVTLQNLDIAGNLYLSAGIGNGEVTLDGVNVRGKTIIQGGGENSIIIKNTVLKDVVVDKKDGKVRLFAKGNTEIENVKLESGAKLQEDLSDKSNGFRNVDIQIRKKGQIVKLDTKLDSIDIQKETNKDTFIDMTSNTNIKQIEFNNKVKVSKKGKIEKVVIKAEGIKLHQEIKEINMDKKIASVEVFGKKIIESTKISEKSRKSRGGGSGSSNNDKQEDEKKKEEERNKEEENNRKMEISNIKIDSSNLKYFLLKTKEDRSAEQIIDRAFKNIDKEKMFLVRPFKDEQKTLLVYVGNDLKHNVSIKECPKEDLNDLTEGFYSCNEGNILVKENEDGLKVKQRVRFIAGNNSTEDIVIAGEYLFAIPEFGSITSGIELASESKYVGGITLNLEKTKIESTKSMAAISNGEDRFGNLLIENNILDFGKNSDYIVKGICTLSPVNGKLSIKNNIIKGFNLGNKNGGPLNGSGAIQIIERLKENAKVSIENNSIQNTAYHGIGICPGKIGEISIVGNQLHNIGQNAICVSKFEGANNININGNKITSYGTRTIKRKASWNDPTIVESNTSENAIALDFIDKNYGLQLNNKWFNTQENICNEFKNSNEIITKEENDKLNGVMDCTEISINRGYNFINPAEYINKYESRTPKKDSLVIVKDKDGDIVYGYDEEYPSEKIVVENLMIIGDAEGRVVLSKGLVVEGDLIIDLPNANLLNGAEVKGNLEIKNIKSLDASNATFTVISGDNFTLSSALDTGMIVEISNVVNKEEKSVSKDKTNFIGNIKVHNGSDLLETSDYEIDDNLDRVTIKKSYLDTLTENVKIRIEYTDTKNKISKIQSSAIEINISDESNASIELVSGNEFIVTEAPKEGAKITITNIKDKNGDIVDSKKSKLEGNIRIEKYGESLGKENYTIDDNTDTITIKKEFLDGLQRTHSTFMQIPTMGEYDVYYEDKENCVSKVESRITFKIENRSFATIKITSGDTFTVGKAPDEGITISITDIKDYAGKSVSSKESDLVGGIKVMPFPVNWDRMTANEGLKREFYTIDDDLDTITLKKSYLDLLEIKEDKDAEKGIKIFRIEYRDPIHKTEVSSSKLPVSIKKVEAPRSKSTVITSKEDAYEILEQEGTWVIKAKNEVISSDMIVKDFLRNIKRENERQRLRVYGLEDVQGDRVPAENMNHYKADYMTLYEGDVLLVTAEDGSSHKLYTIEVKSVESIVKDSIQIKETSIVHSIKNNIMSVRDGKVTIQELKDALEIKNGANVLIKNSNGDIIEQEDMRVTATMKVVVTMNDASAVYKIKLGGKPVYRALLVGNSDYPGDKMDLVGPKNDLDLLEKMFKTSIFDKDTKINPIKKVENRLKSQVFSDIKNTFRDAKDNDVSYFYYSGHGNRKGDVSYLCTVSAEESDWISVSELERELSKIPGTKVVILDCCNAGGFIDKSFVSAGINEPEYFNNAVVKTFKQSKKGFLNGNEFKVLTASSANEYSFESKAEAIGRFTKALAHGCGLDNKFKADQDGDNLVTMMEAYEYLDKNVSATSHVQVYPYNDDFILLGNPTGIKIEIKNSIDISAPGKYTIINRERQKMIMGKEEQITTKVKVKDFLNNIQKDHEEQVLEVYEIELGKLTNKKDDNDFLSKGNLLLVTAEDGTQAKYSISVKDANVVDEKQSSVVVKASIDYNIENGNISSYFGPTIDTEMTVTKFLEKIIKDHKDQKLYVFNKDANTENIAEAKKITDKLAVEDKLLVISADGKNKKIYNIIVKQVAPVPTTDKDDTLDIDSSVYRVVSMPAVGHQIGPNVFSGVKLDTNTKVSDFIKNIIKKNEKQKLYVFGKTVDVKDITKAKKQDDKMQPEDKLLVVAENESTRIYTITIAKSEIPTIEKDGTLDITSIEYTIDTKAKTVSQEVYGKDKIDTNTKVSDFIGNITKGNENQALYVVGKDVEDNYAINAKGQNETLEIGDKLIVVAENKATRTYTIHVEKAATSGGGLTPPPVVVKPTPGGGLTPPPVVVTPTPGGGLTPPPAK